MHTSEKTITYTTVAQRQNLTPEQVAGVVEAFRALGYRLEKVPTHASVQLPKLSAFPSVLEGDR